MIAAVDDVQHWFWVLDRGRHYDLLDHVVKEWLQCFPAREQKRMSN